MTIWDTNADQALSHDPISPVNFMDQRALPVFEDAAAWWRPGINLTEPGRDPMRVNTIEASGNLFDVLGIRRSWATGSRQEGPCSRAASRWPSSATGCGATASTATGASSGGPSS